LLRLLDTDAMIYRRASKESEPIGFARTLKEPIKAEALVPSLDGERYWKFVYPVTGALSQAIMGMIPYGYLHADAAMPVDEREQQPISGLGPTTE
jgi:hypothetical protein